MRISIKGLITVSEVEEFKEICNKSFNSDFIVYCEKDQIILEG